MKMRKRLDRDSWPIPLILLATYIKNVNYLNEKNVKMVKLYLYLGARRANVTFGPY